MRDVQVDVLVAGSGAAGLVAAITARTHGAVVRVIEAGNRFGGTTALGGGRVWIPANGTPANAGDSPDLATEYLRQLYGPYPEMIDQFVATAPEMSRFVEAHTSHRFIVCPNYPDYHPDLAGATEGGRAFDAAPVDTRVLVAEASRVLTPPGYVPITHAEWEAWRTPQRYDTALIRRRRADGILAGGPALVAALLDAAIRARIPVEAETELIGLIVGDDGSVCGARVVDARGERTILARTTILATGGFDADDELRRRYLPEPLGASASVPTDTGIAVKLALRHGFAVDNLSQGWWMPMMWMPGETLGGGIPYPRALIRERGVPHQIVVNSAGRRFLDESLPYNDFGKALHARAADDSYPNRDAYIIVDTRFRERYGLPGLGASGAPAEQYVSAATIDGLARRLGIDADTLVHTVDRWNAFCAQGRDDDFRRGENVYDRYYGDPGLEGNRNLGAIDQPPYYATRVFSATIGSKGGPITTTQGAVIRLDATEVGGLYAVGNAAAFWTADGYPGPGATLAAGMTFGYRAGRAAAAEARDRTLS